VTERVQTESRPLEKNPTVSFEKLLDAAALGTTEVAAVESLAGRLIRLERRFDAELEAEVVKTANGQTLSEIAKGMLSAIDPDKVEEASRLLMAQEQSRDGSATFPSTTLILKLPSLSCLATCRIGGSKAQPTSSPSVWRIPCRKKSSSNGAKSVESGWPNIPNRTTTQRGATTTTASRSASSSGSMLAQAHAFWRCLKSNNSLKGHCDTSMVNAIACTILWSLRIMCMCSFAPPANTRCPKSSTRGSHSQHMKS
jgi:hypothetical protein